MFNRLFGFIVFVSVISCNQKENQSTSTNTAGAYTINGKITGIAKGEMIICRKMMADVAVADTAFAAADGSFSFKGEVVEPMITSIYLPKTVEETQMAISFFTEVGTTNIEADVLALNKAKVNGGNSNKDLQAITAITEKYYAQMKVLGDSLRTLYDAGKMEVVMKLEQQYLQLEQKQKEDIADFIKNNPKSYASAYYAYQLNTDATDPSKAVKAFESLDKSIQSSFYAQKLKKIADALQATAIGSIAPDFTLQSIDDKPVALSSLRGKYVLLDFWASWCGPCRKENPNVVKAYNQFKNKNFTVFGVSLDEDKIAWQNAVLKDQLAWQHVSDLKGWRSSAAALYGVQSIPANFLLDPSGKIIAKDLRGKDLEKMLASVLK